MGCVSSTFNHDAHMKFSKQYIRIINRYLPHFPTDEPSNNDDRLTAFTHWEKVFKENIHMDARHTIGSGTPIGKLYQTFYEYLFEHYPHLKPLFQASIQIQSRVLVHISSGMKSLLSSEDLVQKVMELALVHMKIGVAPEDFDPLGESLIQSMKITSGDDWNDQIERAWRRIYCHASILILVNIPNTTLDMGDFKD
uniref:Globin domain-containing protein n=1 Tax=Globisporangium ultimum (strain ATCC 200006 / CBS 805.95 / DAOM BR144) TaxID=431595 RepID=K3WQF9_GLOUD